MIAWSERAPEEARLFNPAFLLALLAAAASDYEGRDGEPMPWLLGFLIPPLVLAERTRQSLPASVRAHFANWLDEHPEVRLGFARRAPALTPLTREAMRLGVATETLSLEDGYLADITDFHPPQEAIHRRCGRSQGRFKVYGAPDLRAEVHDIRTRNVICSRAKRFAHRLFFRQECIYCDAEDSYDYGDRIRFRGFQCRVGRGEPQTFRCRRGAKRINFRTATLWR